MAARSGWFLIESIKNHETDRLQSAGSVIGSPEPMSLGALRAMVIVSATFC